MPDFVESLRISGNTRLTSSGGIQSNDLLFLGLYIVVAKHKNRLEFSFSNILVNIRSRLIGL